MSNVAGPNILLILSDQHRHDVLGCAGNPVVRTPHLDRLAHAGARFTNTWCQSPLCQPSRASLVTGRHVREHGVSYNGMGLQGGVPTIMNRIQDAGYTTAVIGKTHWHAGRSGVLEGAELVKSFGFDHVMQEHDKYSHVRHARLTAYTRYLDGLGLLEPYQEQVDRLDWLGPLGWEGETSVLPQEHDLTCFIADHAIRWLDAFDGSRPFFMWVSFVAPHPPFIADPEWSEFYRDADVPMPAVRDLDPHPGAWADYLEMLRGYGLVRRSDDDEVRRTTRAYYAMVSLIDQKIGELVEAVARKGWRDRTWIVYTSDHGEMLNSHSIWGKNVFYAPSALVPLIVAPPQPGSAGVVHHAPIEHIDVSATLLDIAGATDPTLRGRSLVSALQGGAVDHRPVLSEIGAQHVGHYLTSVCSDGWRYTYDSLRDEACELFDLSEDPEERTNRVNERDSNSVRSHLHALLSPPTNQ